MGMNNQTLELSTLMAALASVPDWRDNRGKHHRLVSVLALVVCGLLCGCKSVAAIARFGRWLEPEQQAELGFVAYAPPSVATIWRILTQIEAKKLEQILSVWAGQAPASSTAINQTTTTQADTQGLGGASTSCPRGRDCH